MQQLRRRRLVILILMITVLAQCSCGVDSEKELVGTYRVENQEGYAILTLRADKTYRQEIHYKDGRKLVASGGWDFNAELQFLTLRDNYRVFYTNFGDKIDIDGLSVDKIFGTVRLTTDGNYDLAYKKQAE